MHNDCWLFIRVKREAMALDYKVPSELTAFDSSPVVYYGAGAYAEDFIQRRCLAEKRLPLPDYICDDQLGGTGSELCGVPIVTGDVVRDMFGRGVNPVIMVMALSGGNLAIAGKNAGEWEFRDVRLGRCLDMGLELEDRCRNGDFYNAREILGDDKSRRVFDFVTVGFANGGVWFRPVFEENPYFNNDVIPNIRDDEHYVDAGACRGEEMARLAVSNPKYGSITAFEPDGRYFPSLVSTFNDQRIKLRRQGLSDANGTLYINDTGVCARLTVGSTCTGGKRVEVVRLDDSDVNNASLIKMDIEGLEEAALRGAQRVIGTLRPRLAISAYHKVSDIFVLSRLIHELQDDYRLYLRHHSSYASGTVLYAV